MIKFVIVDEEVEYSVNASSQAALSFSQPQRPWIISQQFFKMRQ